MINLIDQIKKLFRIDEKSEREAESYTIADNDTYVPQVYANPIAETDENVIISKSQNEEEGHDIETYEAVDTVNPHESIEEFVLTKHSAVESTANKHECESFTTKEKMNPTIHVAELLYSLANIIEEYDSYLQRVENPEVRQVIELLQHRIIECLSTNGIETIKNDTEFNCLEHIAIPFSFVPDGTPIKEVKRVGFVFGESVLLKAQVVV